MKYKLDDKLFIDVNGDKQHLHIRSNKPDGDVLLFVHGGPGVCDRTWVMPAQSKYLADYCVMVCWDQRMAGKSFNEANINKNITVNEMIEDMHEVVLYLCKRFNKDKICFVGHSWGTILGVCYLQKYPETIKAYVGMGQFVNGAENEIQSYHFVLDYAKSHNDTKAIKTLEEIGEPVDGLFVNNWYESMMIQRNYLTIYGGGSYKKTEGVFSSVLLPLITSGEYSIFDFSKYIKGSYHCLKKLWQEVVKLKFDNTVHKLDVPVYIFQGEHDQNTPTNLVKKWFDELEAPYKELVLFHESAHAPIKEEAELWGTTLRNKLFIK